MRSVPSICALWLVFLLAAPPARAAVAFRAAGSVTSGNVASITLPAPAGTVATDVVLAVLHFSNTSQVITPPAGWTLAKQTNETTTETVVFWGLGSATFGAFTGTFNSVIGFTVGYTGVENATPMDATAVGQANASSATITAPSITTVTPNAFLVGFFGIKNLSTFSAEFGTHRQSGSFAGTTSVALDCADLVQAVAGASGAKTVTGSIAGVNIGTLVALRNQCGNMIALMGAGCK